MTRPQLTNLAIIIDKAKQLTQTRDARGVFRTQANIWDKVFQNGPFIIISNLFYVDLTTTFTTRINWDKGGIDQKDFLKIVGTCDLPLAVRFCKSKKP